MAYKGERIMKRKIGLSVFTFQHDYDEKQSILLAKKAGVYGMIGGQTADIEGEEMEQDKVTNELLLFIHENKTAAKLQQSYFYFILSILRLFSLLRFLFLRRSFLWRDKYHHLLSLQHRSLL